MSDDDFLLFIDANKYLDLYRIDQGRKLLAPLGEQAQYVFVTQQVVDEVQRNKISVAADFLREKFKNLKLQGFNLPDHLFSPNVEQRKSIFQQRKEIDQQIKNMNAEVDNFVLGLLKQISRSEDEVSKALFPIFANAVPHSLEELQKARYRRELGNPPGKSNNPIGDQLTWEQILTHFREKRRLWIISRDGDYGTVYGGKGFLNHFLYNELCRVASEPEVYLFEDAIDGLNHFVDTTGVKAEQRLTPNEAEEIKEEERSLPSLNNPPYEDYMRRLFPRYSNPNEGLMRQLFPRHSKLDEDYILQLFPRHSKLDEDYILQLFPRHSRLDEGLMRQLFPEYDDEDKRDEGEQSKGS
jgi:hypothetical protein